MKILFPLASIGFAIAGLLFFINTKGSLRPLDKDYPYEYVEQLTIMSGIVEELSPHVHTKEDASGNHATTVVSEFIVPEDMYIVGSTGELFNAPNDVFHHIFLFKKESPNECGRYPMLMAKSHTTNLGEQIMRGQFPPGYGILLKKGTTLLTEMMLHYGYNPAMGEYPDRVFKNVSFELHLDVVPAKLVQDIKPIKLIRLWLPGDHPCSEVFSVPALAGRFVRTSGDKKVMPDYSSYTFPKDGAIVLLVGHFHPWSGGKEVKVLLNEKELFTFRASTIEMKGTTQYTIPRIQGNPWLWRVKQGDRITYETVYENLSDANMYEGTAIVYAFVHEESK